MVGAPVPVNISQRLSQGSLWTEGFSVCYSRPVPRWLLFVDGRFFCVLLSSLTAVVVVCGRKVFLWFFCVLVSSLTAVVVV